jgi:hypothetical protein
LVVYFWQSGIRLHFNFIKIKVDEQTFQKMSKKMFQILANQEIIASSALPVKQPEKSKNHN